MSSVASKIKDIFHKKKHNKAFTIIELLVTIAIIGILASVVLAAINEARDNGEDKTIMSTLNNMRAQADILYYNAGRSYGLVCNSTQFQEAIEASTINATTTCYNGEDGWAMESELSSGAFYCTDFTGLATTTPTRGLSPIDFGCGANTGTTTSSYTTIAGGGDGDNDGVSAGTEDGGLNGGDMNDDGTLDSAQSSVAALPNVAVGGGAYTALEATTCGTINNLTHKTEAQVYDDPLLDFPVGQWDFTLECPSAGDTAIIKIYLDSVYDTAGWVYYKYANGGYTSVSGVTYGVENVGGTNVTTITYNVTDGGVGDQDGVANGTIVDPAGPAGPGDNPVVSSLSPADDATDVSTTSNLVMTFNENIQAGTGNITLKKTSDDSTVEVHDVSSSTISIATDTLTFNPNADLEYSTEYYVQVDAGAIEDTSSNEYAGIGDTTSWSFTIEEDTSDPDFADVSLLVHANGSDGSTSFSDMSNLAHTLTANGDAQIDTSESKFGGASMQFDGGGDYIESIHNDSFNFGTDDFTIEHWINTTQTGAHKIFLFHAVPGGWGGGWLTHLNLNKARFYWKSGSVILTSTTNINDGTWHHIAVTREGGVIKLFVDGVEEASADNTNTAAAADVTQPLVFGSDGSSYYYSGHIDEIRITKGVARYTENFTPSEVPFSDE